MIRVADYQAFEISVGNVVFVPIWINTLAII